jgi:hypothetical protein
MKIGVISDTHLTGGENRGGWRKLLERGPNNLEGLIHRLEPIFADVEMVVHAGDINSQSVLDELAKFGPVEAVQGNTDRTVLTSLPTQKVLELGGFNIGVIHGWGASEDIQKRIRERFKQVDAIIYGHTHEPFNRVIDGLFFFNPGSPTDNFFAPYKSVGVLKISQTIEGEIIKL